MNLIWKWLYIGTFLILLPWAENAFTLPKHLWFMAFTQILLVWWCTQVNIKTFLSVWWQEPLFRSGLLVSAILILSTLFSTHLTDSLWGSFYRHQGLIYSLHLGIFFLITHWLILKRSLDVFPTIANTLTIVSILGISQRFLPVANYADITNEGIRIFSTLGQANFLGYAIAIGLPLFWKLWKEKRYSQTTLSISIAINLAALFLTLSRSAWLAVLAIFATITLIVLWKQYQNIFWITLAGSILSLGFLLFIGPQIADQVENPIIRRILKITDVSSPTVQSRLLIWRAGIDVWQESPLLGIGLDTIQNVIPPFVSLDILNYEAGSKVPDRFHNIWLDILVTQGLLGLLAWLLLLGIIIRLLFKQQSTTSQVAFCSLGIYIIALQFGFATITDQIMMISIFASCLPHISFDSTKNNKAIIWQSWGVAVFCIPLLLLSFQNTYASVMTKTSMAMMDGAVLERQIPRSFHPGYLAYFTMETYRKQLQASFSKQTIDAELLEKFQTSHQTHLDTCTQTLLQTYLCTFAAARAKDTLGVILKDQNQYKQATDLYQKTLETNPLFLEAYLENGLLFVKQNNCKEAVSLFETYLMYERFPHPRAQEYLDKCLKRK